MKKFVLLYFIFCNYHSTFSQTNVYHPFPDSSGVVWTSTYSGDMSVLHTEQYSYVIGGVVSIGANIFHMIFIPYVQSWDTNQCLQQSGWQGSIREDTATRIVYYVLPWDTVQRVLYDFSLQVGDPFHGFMRHFIWTNTSVLGIDSMLIGSNYRKMWYIGDSLNPNDRIRVVEGIGYLGGLLESSAGNLLDGPRVDLNCFQENGQTLYLYNSTQCDIIDATPKIIPEQEILNISLVPNPLHTCAKFWISSAGIVNSELKIYNALGALVREEKIPNINSYILYRAGLSAGLYFFDLRTNNNELKGSGKFVIE